MQLDLAFDLSIIQIRMEDDMIDMMANVERIIAFGMLRPALSSAQAATVSSRLDISFCMIAFGLFAFTSTTLLNT